MWAFFCLCEFICINKQAKWVHCTHMVILSRTLKFDPKGLLCWNTICVHEENISAFTFTFLLLSYETNLIKLRGHKHARWSCHVLPSFPPTVAQWLCESSYISWCHGYPLVSHLMLWECHYLIPWIHTSTVARKSEWTIFGFLVFWIYCDLIITKVTCQ